MLLGRGGAGGGESENLVFGVLWIEVKEGVLGFRV